MAVLPATSSSLATATIPTNLPAATTTATITTVATTTTTATPAPTTTALATTLTTSTPINVTIHPRAYPNDTIPPPNPATIVTADATTAP